MISIQLRELTSGSVENVSKTAENSKRVGRDPDIISITAPETATIASS
jgi:hypothetical protein